MCHLVCAPEMSQVIGGAVAKDESVLEPQPALCQQPISLQHCLPSLKVAFTDKTADATSVGCKETSNFSKPTTIISCRKKSDQLSLCKPFKPIHNTFMSSYNELQFVSLTEICDSVRLQV